MTQRAFSPPPQTRSVPLDPTDARLTPDTPGRQATVPWWAHVSAAVAPSVLLLLCLHSALTGSGDHVTGSGARDLAAGVGQWLTPTALTVAGAALVVTAAGMRPADLTGRWVLAIGGAFTVVGSWLPMLGHHGFWHTIVTNLALVTLCVWPALLTPERRRVPAALRRPFGRSLAVGLGALLLLYVSTDPSGAAFTVDLPQGLLMTAQSATPLVILLALRRNPLAQQAARGGVGSRPGSPSPAPPSSPVRLAPPSSDAPARRPVPSTSRQPVGSQRS